MPELDAHHAQRPSKFCSRRAGVTILGEGATAIGYGASIPMAVRIRPIPTPAFTAIPSGTGSKARWWVDTVALLPQAYSGGERGRGGAEQTATCTSSSTCICKEPDTLLDDLDITANKLLSKPWHTTRKYYRQRAQKYDIVEGVCTQGSFTDCRRQERQCDFRTRLNFTMAFP